HMVALPHALADRAGDAAQFVVVRGLALHGCKGTGIARFLPQTGLTLLARRHARPAPAQSWQPGIRFDLPRSAPCGRRTRGLRRPYSCPRLLGDCSAAKAPSLRSAASTPAP